MFDEICSSEDNYKKREQEVKSKIKEIGSKSKVLKSMSEEVKLNDDPIIKRNRRLVDMIVRESLEMYEEGEMNYKEMVEDIYKSLKAIK